ncbi:hypothetical protein NP493_1208g00013 [Ridgeia piscesae]|uniref:Uncharacterized protein n=1 Tax=Ridgeia piscesae TaxID=27915 RepID=A0AAD9KEG7_RIDPI|nr:hypothetical protein NP493_1208g00013 [Ridgeia piscesae]
MFLAAMNLSMRSMKVRLRTGDSSGGWAQPDVPSTVSIWRVKLVPVVGRSSANAAVAPPCGSVSRSSSFALSRLLLLIVSSSWLYNWRISFMNRLKSTSSIGAPRLGTPW